MGEKKGVWHVLATETSVQPVKEVAVAGASAAGSGPCPPTPPAGRPDAARSCSSNTRTSEQAVESEVQSKHKPAPEPRPDPKPMPQPVPAQKPGPAEEKSAESDPSDATAAPPRCFSSSRAWRRLRRPSWNSAQEAEPELAEESAWRLTRANQFWRGVAGLTLGRGVAGADGLMGSRQGAESGCEDDCRAPKK